MADLYPCPVNPGMFCTTENITHIKNNKPCEGCRDVQQKLGVKHEVVFGRSEYITKGRFDGMDLESAKKESVHKYTTVDKQNWRELHIRKQNAIITLLTAIHEESVKQSKALASFNLRGPDGKIHL